MLSGRSLCDGLITRPEESYRLWRVVVCDQETSRMRRLKRTPTTSSVLDTKCCCDTIHTAGDTEAVFYRSFLSTNIGLFVPA